MVKSMPRIDDAIGKVLITKQQIEKRNRELADIINRDYEGKEVMLVSILSGGFIFAADIIRLLNIPATISFIYASSYGTGTTSSGNVEIRSGKGFEPAGKDIIIVEDIIDTGNTLKKVSEYLANEGAKSVEIMTFLDKPSRRIADISAKYVGFEIPDEFVVGYGLDYAYKYRQLPYVGVMKPEFCE